ncbi:hypothetical protein [Streptomyces kanasensis]|uniref:hypothetical protein n=1 Tax=Streptomyces kanasensis TaxID=936756 RepID=UPI0038117942
MFARLVGSQLGYTALTGYHDTARLTVVSDDALDTADGPGRHWLAALLDLDAADGSVSR